MCIPSGQLHRLVLQSHVGQMQVLILCTQHFLVELIWSCQPEANLSLSSTSSSLNYGHAPVPAVAVRHVRSPEFLIQPSNCHRHSMTYLPGCPSSWARRLTCVPVRGQSCYMRSCPPPTPQPLTWWIQRVAWKTLTLPLFV